MNRWRAERNSRRHRTESSVIGVSAGVLGLLAIHLWPNQAAQIQMTLLSFLVIVPVIWGHWGRRHMPRFKVAVISFVVLHGFILYCIRSMFPFRSILPFIPMMLIEGIAGFVIILKFVDDSESNLQI